ncbi:MAG: efflux RND transporter permease subunit [Pirellulaceae bacterium]|nr:efflux RND transporter permease subunit [Planctomycetales bacterium]
MANSTQSPPDLLDSGGAMTRLVDMFLRADVAILFVVVSCLLGLASLIITPREEEPQIVVPLADVLVSAPGLSAREVEHLVTQPLEKLLYQIDGVEYVYSMSRPGQSVVTVRFYVSEDREDSLVKLYNKINSNADAVPPVVKNWVVKPIEVDDVPIVIATLWTDRTDLYGDHELRRFAEELQHQLQAIPNTNLVWTTGGRPRRVRVQLDPQRMAARQTSVQQITRALQTSNVQGQAGSFEQQDTQFLVDVGVFVRDVDELQNMVVNVAGGRPVYLRDVADVVDGPAEVDSYSWIGFGPADEQREQGEVFPAVHIAVGKRKGTNAVWVAEAAQEKLRELSASHLPDGVHVRITRDYGETANDKVNELIEGLVVAVLTVVGLIGLVIGWRAAAVVALAIPVCYSLTLFVNLLLGYTINRVTMFALILALGLLVDDPITDVENIARYFAMRVLPPRESVLRAVQEVRPALILSTLAIIASFAPLYYITGMMGPYMAPMALNVPLTVTVSTIVAFMITPWMSMVALQGDHTIAEGGDEYDVTSRPLYKLSRLILGPIVDRRWVAWLVLIGVAVLLFVASALPLMRTVPLKMLPYDNKNEFQIVIDMPEGTTLDRTDAVARRIAAYVAGEAEVRDYEVYVGIASPMDFNGMVRHYFLRKGPNVADIRVNLVAKEERASQSHALLLRLRQPIEELAQKLGANVKLVEVPPGPPVLSTITAEVYGPIEADYNALIDAGRAVEARLAREPGIVDVDISAEDDSVKWIFETDKSKAALSGISTAAIQQTLAAALNGDRVSVLHIPDEVEPLWVELRVPLANRSAVDELEELYIQGEDGQLVQLASLGRFVKGEEDKTIYHKNLERVVFVYGEVAGRPPADAIIDMQLDQQSADAKIPANPPAVRPAESRTWLSPGGQDPWKVPDGFQVRWAGEGEWKITLDVFRDLGLAFGAALMGIFVILMFQTGSRVLPILIMLAIPLTMIGIMPGFWMLNLLFGTPAGGYPDPTFFTATAMIGMIALAGIVVRNSVVLIDFIHMAQAEGLALREAIIRSVAVRTRPIMLTAGTTLLANWVITLDPVFSGLAWAIIFGIATSTVFTLIVIPTVYWLLYATAENH